MQGKAELRLYLDEITNLWYNGCNNKKINIERGVLIMTELVVDRNSIQEHIFRLIKTDKIVLREVGGEVHLAPTSESVDYIKELRGSLADYPDMSVDNFLRRMREDKELDK